MSKWSGKTKGSVLGYRIFIFFIKQFGIPSAYALLNIVVPVYYLVLSQTKKNLLLTFEKIPHLKSRNYHLIIYKNFYNLGKSLIDNLAILTHHKKKYSYTENGEKYLIKLIEKSEPAILISGHIGSWSIAGELLKKKGTINIVMYDGEAQRIKRLIEQDIGKNNYKIITINDDLSHLFKIKEAVDNGELICIHADRYINGTRTTDGQLLNYNIKLPYGPFSIAAKLNIPYTFVFAIKTSMYTYHFSATKPKTSNNPDIIANEFSNILSEKLRDNPDQWFNYFNIFENK